MYHISIIDGNQYTFKCHKKFDSQQLKNPNITFVWTIKIKYLRGLNNSEYIFRGSNALKFSFAYGPTKHV